MVFVRAYLRSYFARKHVRPWAVSAPIAVLLICLPILSPLRRPLPWQMSGGEASRWATVQALVEQQTFAIEGTLFAAAADHDVVAGHSYSNKPPTQGLLLAGPYWVLYHGPRGGLRFRDDPALVEYLLTVIAVTLPVALAAGMVYRMGRLFELTRPWRAGLGLAVVLGSGMVSYATVLNPYAPAAALTLSAAAILVQVSRTRHPLRSGAYLTFAGFFAALAAAIYPAAAVFAVGFAAVILAMRWRPSLRVGGVLMYGIGCVPPVLLHLSLSLPITGDWRLGLAPVSVPIVMARRPAVPRTPTAAGGGMTVGTTAGTTAGTTGATAAVRPTAADDDDALYAPPTAWQTTWVYLSRVTGSLVGRHGVLVHFPVLVFGVAGLTTVLRRHWPGPAKVLAVATVVAAAVVPARYVLRVNDWSAAMFGVRWYVVFLPMVLFWAGAWARKAHHPATWATAGGLLAFSAVVAVVGATDPMPRGGYDRYTAVAALQRLTSPTPVEAVPVIARR